MAEPDGKNIAADWASRGFRCDLWTDPLGQRWENFTHATAARVALLEGQMVFEGAGQSHRSQVGEDLKILVRWPGLYRARRNRWHGSLCGN